jgi:hypothetical protein
MKILKLLLITTFAFLPISFAHAAPLKMLFFYPGGQGNQEQAQPLLDNFSAALKKASQGKIEAQITYISDPTEGLQFIKTQKPQAAILGLESYYKYGNELGAKVIAKTLQLPSGDGTDQYFLLGKSGATLPTSGSLQVSSTRPLDPSFISEKLFPQWKDLKIEVQPTANSVGELRAIGSGSKQGFVLLDQFENANISKLKTPWATALTVLAQSQKVSSAPVFVFSQNIPANEAQELENALVEVGSDNSAKSTLADLRLKGFKKASAADFGN